MFATNVYDSTNCCFQSHSIKYQEFLDENFDGTANYLNPIAQIYASSKSGNEVYNLKEMLQQPDRKEFIAAIHDEVKTFFDKDFWVKVPRREMEHIFRMRNEQVDS